MDAVLRAEPKLRPCAVQCCHCEIHFLTHPRNSGRQNLRCPFGCQEHHRRQRSNERSREHYKNPSAKKKKKLLNGKRSRSGSATPVAELPVPPSLAEQGVAEVLAPGESSVDATASIRVVNIDVVNIDVVNIDAPARVACPSPREGRTTEGTGGTLPEKPVAIVLELPLEGFVLNEQALRNSSVLGYAAMVASLILERTISREALLARLLRRMRQHSIGRLSRREYVLQFLNQHPP